MPPLILVVDDEPAIADAVLYALRQEGWRTAHAATVTAARAAVATEAPALVVLDIGLPDGSGLDLARAWAGRFAVLMLSARASEIDRVVGLELGADDYLTKPFSPRELVARVRAILRRAAPPALVATGRLIVDAQRLVARWDGRALDLPRQQFRLLAILAQDPGRVWSRSELMDAAWDHPEEAFDRAVDSQIRHLRAALAEAAPGIEVVRTVRGEGYALAEGLVGG